MQLRSDGDPWIPILPDYHPYDQAVASPCRRRRAEASVVAAGLRLAQRLAVAAKVMGTTSTVDHISRLPDDLLLDVLSRLDSGGQGFLGSARLVARTSGVARRWRGLWASLPELTFRVLPVGSLPALLAQVTRPSLDLLEIIAFLGKAAAPGGRVSSVLLAAQRLKPKNLVISLAGRVEGDEAIELPCVSLMLDLSDVKLSPPQAGEFTALKSLILSSSNMEPGALIPMCPSLSFLSFLAYSDFDVVTVHSTSLEELVVECRAASGYEIGRIDVMAPLLKEARFRIQRAAQFSVLFWAPVVEKISWTYSFEHGNVGLPYAVLLNLNYSLSDGVHGLSLDIAHPEPGDEERSFEQEIMQLPCSQYSNLELYVGIGEHTFGPLVLHLLQIPVIRQIQMLRLDIDRPNRARTPCGLNCPCEQPNNWRNESISLTDLEVVRITGFKGEDDEVDFLKVLFRSATILKSMTVSDVTMGLFGTAPAPRSMLDLAPASRISGARYDQLQEFLELELSQTDPMGYEKICSICAKYPHVKCQVYPSLTISMTQKNPRSLVK
ncbi:hypothetical protein ACP70R_028388 [Stipagrostis hirtigluma subsp. patula]